MQPLDLPDLEIGEEKHYVPGNIHSFFLFYWKKNSSPGSVQFLSAKSGDKTSCANPSLVKRESSCSIVWEEACGEEKEANLFWMIMWKEREPWLCWEESLQSEGECRKISKTELVLQRDQEGIRLKSTKGAVRRLYGANGEHSIPWITAGAPSCQDSQGWFS